MTRYIALLRGVNVGGRNKVAMPDLRALFEGLGHTDVATYINSGNVVFTSGTPELDQLQLAAAVEAELARRLGVEVAVIVRSSDEVTDAVQANPFPDADPSRLLIMFLAQAPDRAAIDQVAAVESGRDESRVIGTNLFLHFPDGVGKSKLWASVGDRIGVVGTARNLRTVRRLLEMARTAETGE
ncbi:DUF1697 domain-containing protein [Haloactinopolyspora sp.]|uniref:DUF1697 domain-containing protein n=1 Tax=Haloactinopolyspora sp. TaxID=1966353 RepID=UPI00262A533D|nr:DUF1697 domain-containing protein [Haloactinopolyspora sp.]